ncbi:MAG TPA: hypothetical protein VK698_06960 [Kofleriaceae bacterium]|nr:hypothetical protein [Kofleriaceae bacterium]
MRVLPAVLALAVGCSGGGPETGGGGAAGGSGAAGGGEAGGRAATPSATGTAPGAAADHPAAPAGPACRAMPFAASLDLPEASGAVWVEPSFGLPAHLIVVSDSGNHGAFAVVDAKSGAELGSGQLPLERGVSDDLEGLARAGGVYYALTSGGYMRHFRRTGAARFELAVPAYALPGASCDSPRRGNCGRDLEGLCLADPLPATGCAGFAASRRDGELVCLQVGAGGRLRPEPSQTIRFALPMTLSDCNIAPAAAGGALHAATNGFGGNTLLLVHGWHDPATARVEIVPGHATGFIEAVAAGPGGAIYRFSDNGGPASPMFADSCPQAGPE